MRHIAIMGNCLQFPRFPEFRQLHELPSVSCLRLGVLMFPLPLLPAPYILSVSFVVLFLFVFACTEARH